MQVHRYLKAEYIQLGLRHGHLDGIDPEKDEARERVRLKEEVIEELTDLFLKTGHIRNRSKFHHDFLSRERKATTAIGHGLAVPHVRSLQPKQLALVVARSRDGVEFAAPDGKPVHLFFGLTAPSYDEKATKDFLLFYQWIGRHFRDSDWLLESVLEAKDAHEIVNLLAGLE